MSVGLPRPDGKRGRRAAEPFAYSLRLLVAMPMVWLALVATVAAAGLAMVNGRLAVNDVAAQLRAEELVRIKDRLAHYLDVPPRVNALNAQALRAGVLRLDDPTNVQRYFYAVLQAHPTLAYSFFGTTTGEFYGARRLADGTLQIVRAGAGTGGASHNFVAGALGDAGQLVQVYPGFDPRQRPWYRAALAAGGPTWTPIYRHFVLRDLALTATLPYDDEHGVLMGVFGVDYVLTRVAEFLHSIEISANDRIFLLETDGNLIASNDPNTPRLLREREENSQFARLAARDARLTLEAAATRVLEGQPGGLAGLGDNFMTTFWLDRRRHYLQASAFAPAPGLRWIVAVAVPEADFMSRIDDLTRDTALAIAGILALAALVGLFVSSCLAAPIERFVGDAERMARGEWSRLPGRSRVREIRRLDLALTALGLQLQRFFAQLRAQTERIRADNALLEQRVAERTAELDRALGRLRAFFDNIPGYIVVVDHEFRIVSVSQQLLELFGIADDSVGGRHCYELLWGLSAPCPQCDLPQCFATGRTRVRYPLAEEQQRFPDKALQLFSGAIRDARGALIGGMVYAADITDLRAMERELILAREAAEAANRAKSDFLARMSHEIRTPMNAILGLTETMLYGDLPTETRELLEIVRGSSAHLLALINDILDLSKIEAGRMELSEEDFSLATTLDRLLATCRVTAVAKGLTLTLARDPEVPDCLRGDLGKLRQILFNLLGNALKFTERGGIVLAVTRLPAVADSIALRFCVADTGPGIPADMRQRIFEPFTQVDDSARRRHGGTGLGLAVCRELARLLGGEMTLTSELGVGSTFCFEARFAPGDLARVPAVTTAVPERADWPPLRLLLVEDTPVNVLVAQRFLARLGQHAEVAENGHQALERLAREPFDLVLMDIEMPGLDGFETTRQIRAGVAGMLNCATPIVGLTAHALSEYRARGQAVGMNGYIFKPFSLTELRAAIAQALPVLEEAVTADESLALAPPADTADAPALELALPLQRLDGDVALLAETVTMIAADLPAKRHALASALAADDIAVAHRLAHTMKGHLDTVGAERARRLVAAIETALHAERLDTARAHLPRFEAALDELAQMLPAALDELSARTLVS